MARRRFAVQHLESRLAPSFSPAQPMTPAAYAEYVESRADMYTVEADVPPSPAGADVALDLRDFTAVRVDHARLTDFLADLPREGATGPATVFAVPRPDGAFDRFNVWEVEMMEPGLAAEFPTIRTWRGQGIDDPTAVLAADLTPLGFHAQVLGPNGRWYVDPYYHLDTTVYAAYSPDQLRNRHKDGWTEVLVDEPHEEEGAEPPPANRPNYGQTLRTYRTAVAATGEYTAFHGGTVANGQAAIVTAVNRVSGVYETELALRLVLVANNSSLVYTNASTDPYSNGSGGTMLGQNQANVDAVIGTANYDLGHVFSTGGGGVAGLGVVGVTGQKARGVTGSGSPIGDAFWIDYVAHEMGHQYGGRHTFNGNDPNRDGSASYEPGSGSTIMSYAGIMGSDNLQSNSDAYYHFKSLDEISTKTFNAPATGFTQTATGNNIPTADAGPDRVIPARTPFALTGVGTDADPGDVLTYNWEQYDLGPMATLGSPDNGASPLFRSWPATTNPTRMFPRLSVILSGGSSTSEILPTTNWPSGTTAMTFNLTVRDNRVTGAYNSDQVNLEVVDTGAAFAVTSPNTNVNWAGGSTQTVTWNVAGTAAAPINAGQVNILLSTDGGNTFGTVLASGVPNDGSHDVVLPNVNTTAARIKVEAAGNIFFDISNANFRITATTGATGVNSTLANGTYGAGQVVPIQVAFSAPVNVTGSPRLALNSGGTAVYAGGSGTATLTFNYTVAVGHQSADLDYTATTALTLNGGTINAVTGGQPAALNLPAPGAAGSLGANKDLVIATTDIAVVTGVASPAANGTYAAGAVIPITITFDRAVNVTGTPQLALNSGATAIATYVGGSGTTALTFSYTVGALDSSGDLDYASPTALTLNGGTIVSPLTGDPATLTLAAPGAAGSLGAANDLVIGVSSLSLEADAYSGVEGGTVTVTVFRIGPPSGAVSVDYAVTDGTGDGSDYVILPPPPPSTLSPLTWEDGDATPRTIVLQITDDLLSEGRETLNVVLSNPTGSATLGTSSAVVTIRHSDGRVPGKFLDTDGDKVNITLAPKTGFGSLLVYLTNNTLPVSLLETTGTSPTRSAVAVSVLKARTSLDNGTFAVGGVEGSGLKALNLAKSPVAGDGIRLDGMLQSLKLYSLGNGADVETTGAPIPLKKTRVAVKTGVGDGSDFVLGTPVSTFSAGSFGNGRIEAASIGRLTVRGNFTGDVDLSGVGVIPGRNTLGVMKVAGFVDGSAVEVAGRVGSVTVGSFLNSRLFAGFEGTTQGVGAYDPFGAITSFRTTAGGFANSSLVSGTVKNVVLASVEESNGGTKFGVYADFYIQAVTLKAPVETYKEPTAEGFGDFEVKVV